MKFFSNFCITIAFSISSCTAAQIECDNQKYNLNEWDNLVSLIKSKQWNAQIDKHIQYPVNVLISGRVEKYRDSFELKMDWDYILTEQTLAYINESTNCEIAKTLGLKHDGSTIVITNLVFPQVESDRVLSGYGISSVKAYKQFVSNINAAIKAKDYPSISNSINYPFFIDVDGRSIKVLNSNMFLEYSSYIVSNKFIKLLQAAGDLDTLNKHPKGLMLNQSGDIWIVQVKGELKLDFVDLN